MWQLIKCHRVSKTRTNPSVKTLLMPLAASLILLFWIGTAAAQTTVKPTDNRARLDTLRAEGYEALYNLDYEGARKRFREMIQIAPDNPSGPQCFAASLWVEQLNQSWELKATLYSTKAYTEGKRKADPAQAAEFRKWIRQTKTLSEARLKQNPRDIRSEEHTSELQSLAYLVCRLLLEKKKKKKQNTNYHPTKENQNLVNPHSLPHTYTTMAASYLVLPYVLPISLITHHCLYYIVPCFK